MHDDLEDRAVLELLGSIWAVDHNLQAVSKRMLRTIGVTGPQRVALRIIGANEGISPGMLARRLHDHPSTITGVVRRLEQRGLLRRTIDPKDKRRAHLHLTPAGRRVNENREGTAEAAVRATLLRLSPERIAVANEVLGLLTEELIRVARPELVRD